jgi:translation initiation factor 1
MAANDLQEFACNGAVIENKDHGQIIQLSGDKRNKVASFLVEEGFPLSRIKVHGH